MLRIATVNVNGIRAAARKGMGDWLASAGADVICLQEVRATDEILAEHLPDWRVVHDACLIKGRAGVAIASRLDFTGVRIGLGIEGDVHTGRWVEADFATDSGPLTVVSAYVHSGEVGTPKQDAKYVFLEAMTHRLSAMVAAGGRSLVTGDFNIAHTNSDIKNWRGNLKNAGFLPEERSYLDRWFSEIGWVDLGRKLAGDTEGPYTWWSWRGKAFDNDTGWRIDYQIASPELAEHATTAAVGRAASYDTRWSDHAPLVIDYDI